jgi:hypothetical protein
MSAEPYQTWTLLTNEELREGAAAHQGAAAFAHAESVKYLDLGMPDYAAAWQTQQAFNHRAAAELMRFLLRRRP